MARPFNQADIHAKIGDRVDHLLAVADAHIQRQLRKVASIAGDHLRQYVVADSAAGENPNSAVIFPKKLLNVGSLLQQRQRSGVEQTAMLIHHQPFTDAIEKLHAQLPFQIR